MLTAIERNNLKKHVSEDNERLVAIFDTLSDANRCKLFRLVASRPGVNVTEASDTLSLSVPLASQHFKVLLRSNLVSRSKQGREVFYSVNSQDPIVKAILAAINE